MRHKTMKLTSENTCHQSLVTQAQRQELYHVELFSFEFYVGELS